MPAGWGGKILNSQPHYFRVSHLDHECPAVQQRRRLKLIFVGRDRKESAPKSMQDLVFDLIEHINAIMNSERSINIYLNKF